MQTQLDIFPTAQEQGLEPAARNVVLEAVLGVPEEAGDAALAGSIARVGLLQPVLLIGDHPPYRVLKGKRRLAAARRAGIEQVPALIYPADTDRQFLQAVVLSAQHHRSENLVAQVEAIDSLLQREDITLDDIAETLRIPRSTLGRVYRIKRLCRPLFEALRHRRIADSVAKKAATLDPERQARLAEKLDAEGKLTMNDVREAKRARRDAEANLVLGEVLDLEVEEFFPTPLDTARAIPHEWRASLASLETALRLAPRNAPREWTDRLRQLLQDARELALPSPSPAPERIP